MTATDRILRAMRNKDQKDALRTCIKHNCDVRITGSGHVRVVTPDDAVFVLSTTRTSEHVTKRFRAWVQREVLDDGHGREQ